MKNNDLLEQLRQGAPLTRRQQIALTVHLSIPTILAQLSSIIMQYIDASMVGRLGANDSASIGLVASVTWLFGGLNSAINSGFIVLVAQHIGARDERTARNLVKQALAVAISFSLLLMTIGLLISGRFPYWLGADAELCANASRYFFIYALGLPIVQFCNLSGGLLQATGNMRTPSVWLITMCFLDVIFNSLLIFPSLTLGRITIPGANLGVTGAALGTLLAQATVAGFLLHHLLRRSPALHLRKGEPFCFSVPLLQRSIRISLPVAAQCVVMGGAQVALTSIVAPLKTIAIAANSFAVTAESLCYMPGNGIANASSTLIGQSVGAKRRELAYQLGWIGIILGMCVMTVTGALMYIAAPWMIGILSPDPAIISLGAEVLRIEAFAEPFFAASIVASGVFQGAGSTKVSTVLNMISMWGIRVPLSALLAPRYGLHGVWIVMATELTVRGILFLIHMVRKRWLPADI